jgi:hypothetical protein
MAGYIVPRSITANPVFLGRVFLSNSLKSREPRLWYYHYDQRQDSCHTTSFVGSTELCNQ